MSTFRVQVYGIDGVRRALRPLLEPEITQILDAANKSAAQALAKGVRAEASPVSKHMAHAVRLKRARTGKPGWVVGSRRKTPPGFYPWHMVIGGTRAHGPRRANALVFIPGFNPYLGASSHGAGNGWVRARQVAGVPANDIVGRAVAKYETATAAAIELDVAKRAGL